jgi:hypothetical protein
MRMSSRGKDPVVLTIWLGAMLMKLDIISARQYMEYDYVDFVRRMRK